MLYRVLRHNLRNVCNVIEGNSEMLAHAEAGSALSEDCLAAVREETDRLLSRSDETRVLQDALRGPCEETDHDVAALMYPPRALK